VLDRAGFMSAVGNVTMVDVFLLQWALVQGPVATICN
jgi:hypothetical protein